MSSRPSIYPESGPAEPFRSTQYVASTQDHNFPLQLAMQISRDIGELKAGLDAVSQSNERHGAKLDSLNDTTHSVKAGLDVLDKVVHSFKQDLDVVTKANNKQTEKIDSLFLVLKWIGGVIGVIGTGVATALLVHHFKF